MIIYGVHSYATWYKEGMEITALESCRALWVDQNL